MTKTTMSNAIARKYFLHDHDTNADTGTKCAYFSERPYDETGWGIWVNEDGSIDRDDTSANGELPSRRIVEACRRAAVKFLKS